MEKCYTVAETVKLTGVKSYVLRYWEDELSLPIRRNELGHRCYTQDDIQLFLNIKELKNRGLQLRAIHDLLPKLTKKEGMEVIVPEEKDKIHLLEYESIEKEENETRDTLREELLENVQNFKAEPDKKILEFQEILERLITQELHAQKEGEDRWRTLDAAIRRQQMARREAAAASEKKGKKKKHNGGTSVNSKLLRKPIQRCFLLFLAPTFLAFCIGFIYPFLRGIYLSFCKFVTIGDASFVGFRNYMDAFNDASFIHAFWYTALYAIVSLFIINVLGFNIFLL